MPGSPSSGLQWVQIAFAMPKNNHHDIGPIIHDLNFHPDERADRFLALSYDVRGAVLLRLTRHILHELMRDLPDSELVMTLEQLDPDEATDVMQVLSHARQKTILAQLNEEMRNGVRILTQFDPHTAAGLMNIDYIQVEPESTIVDIAKKFKAHEKRTGRLPAIIAIRDGKVVGYVPGHELGFGRATEQVGKFIRRIPTVTHDADHDAVLKVFRDHPHNKVVVLGERGNVVGIIYSDDILRVMEQQQAASLYDFAGVHDEETVSDSTHMKIMFRYKWLIINLGTAFLAAFTVNLFEATIAKYVLLAVYMPVVAGMGGNAATQTLAVMVRGISLKQIDLSSAGVALRRELAAGFVNGLLNGLIVAAVVLVFNGDRTLALVLFIAMIVNLLVAAFFGTMMPLVMKRLGKDPAASATIFITTATDVLGFLAFLGLATLLLN